MMIEMYYVDATSPFHARVMAHGDDARGIYVSTVHGCRRLSTH
jgi:hypothetical protein